MFESTIPFGEPELMRASAYQTYLSELDAKAAGHGMSSRLASLSPAVRVDLHRFEADGGVPEALDVIAACMRHAERVTMHLQYNDRVVPLTVFPDEQLVHCPLALKALSEANLADLAVLHVEPAVRRPPGDEQQELVGDEREHHRLAPLLWDLALQGARAELLPEIAGTAAYRARPGFDASGLNMPTTMRAAVYRLNQGMHTLRDIADWPGFDREKAARLLNALYLQSGLIVSRSHPVAIGQSWFGSRL